MGWFSKKVGPYELGKTIGKGHFSKVKYGVHSKTKEKVAIKVMERKALQGENMEEQVKREIAIMRKLNHKHITKLRDVYQTKRHVYLVLELVEGGELFDKIVSSKRFDEVTARKYFQQLTMGTLYCHMHNVAHRDLKPENLMLDEAGDLKISDFGLSNLQPSEDGAASTQLQTMCGTPEYVAPEVLAGHGYSGFTADCWSCGVILYVMLAGSLPFRDTSSSSVFAKIRHANYEMKPYFPEGAKDLIANLLVVDPNKRFTLEQVVDHPWFRTGFDASELTKLKESPCPDIGSLAAQDIEHAIEDIDEEEEEHQEKGEKGPKTTGVASDAHITREEYQMLSEIRRADGFGQDSYLENHTRFGLQGGHEQVTDTMIEVLNELNCHPELKKSIGIKCSTENANGLLTFTAVVSRTPRPEVSVVNVRMGRGDKTDFLVIYRTLVTKLCP